MKGGGSSYDINDIKSVFLFAYIERGLHRKKGEMADGKKAPRQSSYFALANNLSATADEINESVNEIGKNVVESVNEFGKDGLKTVQDAKNDALKTFNAATKTITDIGIQGFEDIKGELSATRKESLATFNKGSRIFVGVVVLIAAAVLAATKAVPQRID